MNLFETFRVAFEAIQSNKVRSGLTMLGVIIGVMAVILLVSIGEGARVTSQRNLPASAQICSSSLRAKPVPAEDFILRLQGR